MTVYALIDLSDGEEHDRYEDLHGALCDAIIRSSGLCDHDDPGKMKLVRGYADELVERWNRSATVTGPFGKWRVVGRRA